MMASNYMDEWGEIGPFLISYYVDRESQETDQIVLPVAPGDVKPKYSWEFADVSLLGLGEADLQGGDRLAQVEISSFIPRDYDPSLIDRRYGSVWDPKIPLYFEQLIHRIRQTGRPVHVIIGGTNINWSCKIRDFQVEHRAGEPGDLYYTVSLKKHRAVTLERRTADFVVPSRRPPRRDSPPTVKGPLRDPASKLNLQWLKLIASSSSNR